MGGAILSEALGNVVEMTGESVLTVEGLKVYYYTMDGVVKAVDGVDLQIPEGKTVALVGESGCGKSTVALSIMRLILTPGRIVEGRIMNKGRNLLELSENKMRTVRGNEISMIFQNPSTYLNPVMKVGDQIGEIIRSHGNVSKDEARRGVMRALALVRMPSPETIYDYYPHQLSGGMQQRILIATALSCNPSVLIADEPTTALDVSIQSQILSLMKELRNELKISLLLITHDLGIVADIADIVYVMYAGKIVEEADVFTLYEKPKHPYTAGLLSSVISIDEFKSQLSSIGGAVPDLRAPPSGCRFHPRCPKVMQICKQSEPKNFDVGRNHIATCWLYGK